MSTHITSDQMFSNGTAHTAALVGESWRVTWLPERDLTREEAVTAMQIAETVAADCPIGASIWVRVANQARSLGFTSDRSVRFLAALTPEEARFHFDQPAGFHLLALHKAELYCPGCQHPDYEQGCSCDDINCACTLHSARPAGTADPDRVIQA